MTNADDAGVNVRELLARELLTALNAERADKANSDAPYVHEYSLMEVKVDGSLNLLQLADAILAAGFGDVAGVKATALEQVDRAIRAHRVFYHKTNWTDRDRDMFNLGLSTAMGAVSEVAQEDTTDTNGASE